MRLYFAPLEGITGHLYRNAHHDFYTGIDKYYTPFLSPGPTTGLGEKMLRDILPEKNPGIPLVPQLLTNRAGDFIKSVEIIRGYGYREVNLNLGCPSGTVVAKKKGSGFLYYPEELEQFLDEIYESGIVVSGEVEISIKTRIGKNSPEEWPKLMEIYNRYPVKELIIHPRIQKDFYRNDTKPEAFEYGLAMSRNPVVYNGDLFTLEDVVEFTKKFPTVDTVMIGRGLITDPGLAEKIHIKLDRTDVSSCGNLGKFPQEISGGISAGGFQDPAEISTGSSQKLSQERSQELTHLQEFLSRVETDYTKAFSGDRNVLFKMKELWCYMIERFPDSGNYAKRIKKAQTLLEYQAAAGELFREVKNRCG